jgi:hypothetical protein
MNISDLPYPYFTQLAYGLGFTITIGYIYFLSFKFYSFKNYLGKKNSYHMLLEPLWILLPFDIIKKCYKHILTSIINLIIFFVNFLKGCLKFHVFYLMLCLLTYKQHGMHRVKDGMFTSTLNPTNKVNVHNLSLPLPGLIIFQTFYTFTHLLGLEFFEVCIRSLHTFTWLKYCLNFFKKPLSSWYMKINIPTQHWWKP